MAGVQTHKANIQDIEIVRVSEKGQITLPVSFRRSKDVGKGDYLVVLVRGDELVLRKVSDPILEAWQEARKAYSEGKTVSWKESRALKDLD
ncbi:hypothetical protein HKBW3S06_00261 [Candidatus Hakubella thermalkaliphila]|uniref:SpoVT-AbrB domain-containing protein n=3 Tax=Candidatus Hakubella thermalkaliphila TaxID=2754717 RepID=A0A6V8NLD0_9ACTN|nr:AbrB/MazE/SpoVT family DNA-binding domain-containing protein [Candidatus Hakubella thermalkaliphila]GFP21035.1 hypothetical protein HKBW3S06_00261 [Candidatus Hakubella thermalkaliphila]GFP27462.1 hypothetical protein HKBW3S33_00875 [Candidatus Hakubella thermalkaliphila]